VRSARAALSWIGSKAAVRYVMTHPGGTAASAHEEDLLVAAFHRLTPLQQPAVIDLVYRIAEGMSPGDIRLSRCA